MNFKFIRLTEVNSAVETDITVNAAYISSFKTGIKGKDTLVTMADGRYLFAKQKPETIRKLIGEVAE